MRVTCAFEAHKPIDFVAEGLRLALTVNASAEYGMNRMINAELEFFFES